MKVTVGDIVANMNFDVNCDWMVTEDSDGETILFRSWDNDPFPAEYMVKEVSYITIRNGVLVIEAKIAEE